MPDDCVQLRQVARINPESLGERTNYDFSFKYIDLSAVDHGRIDWSLVRTHVFRTAPSRARRVVREHDVLLCTVRPGLQGHGYITRSDDNLVASTGFAVIRCGSDLDSRYLFHSLFESRVAQQLRERETGTNYPAVAERDVKELLLFCPDKTIQTAIAEILDATDEAIDATEALIGELKAIKAGLLYDLLTRGLGDNGKLRDPAAHPDQFRASALGPVPAEWDIRTLGEALTLYNGRLQTGPFGSQLHAREYLSEGVPVVMPQDIQDGRISIDQIARVSAEKAASLARHRLVPGDIVFARRGELCRAAAVTEREAGWLCGTGCFLLRLPPASINNRWLAAVYRSFRIQRQVVARAVGCTMLSLNNSVMEGLLIAWPKTPEQNEIMVRLDCMDDRIAAETKLLEKLRGVKRGLMQDLLNGRVRVGRQEATA